MALDGERGRELLRLARERTDAMLALLGDLVGLESPTREKAAVDLVAGRIAGELAELGLDVERVAKTDVGDQLIARTAGAGKHLLVLSHMDTVWPLGTVDERPFRVADAFAYGPGTADMKGGIVVALSALRLLREMGVEPAAPVCYLLTSDEEGGSTESRALIEELAGSSLACLVTEPGDLPDGRIKTERKGSARYDIDLTGVESHAGAAHQDGASAVSELARLVGRIDALTDYASGTTTNVGLVRGGSARNVVAGKAEAVVDVRVTSDEERQRIERFMAELTAEDPRVRLRVDGGFERPPMRLTPASRRAVRVARACASAMGFDLPETASGGASDGNFTSALGVPTLDGLGAVGAGIHAVDERIEVDALAPRAALMAALLMTLPAELSGTGDA